MSSDSNRTHSVSFEFMVDSVPTLDLMFCPLFEKTYHILASFDVPRDPSVIVGVGQEVANKLEVQKSWYSFLLKVFQSGCFAVLVSNANAPHFEKVIDCILDGCRIQKGLDVTTHKLCFTILKEMLSAMRNYYLKLEPYFFCTVF